MDPIDSGRLIYLAILVTALLGYMILSGRRRIGQMVRHLALWALIFIGAIAGFGLWNDVSRTIIPQQSMIGAGTVEVPRRADGHYYLTVHINGHPVEFVVDTGASGVVLSHDDARAAGVDPDRLAYTGSANTANGRVRTAQVRLGDVALGPIEDRNVAAYVTDGDLQFSLLGMSYLSRFAKLEIAGDRLVLTR